MMRWPYCLCTYSVNSSLKYLLNFKIHYFAIPSLPPCPPPPAPLLLSLQCLSVRDAKHDLDTRRVYKLCTWQILVTVAACRSAQSHLRLPIPHGKLWWSVYPLWSTTLILCGLKLIIACGGFTLNIIVFAFRAWYVHEKDFDECREENCSGLVGVYQ